MLRHSPAPLVIMLQQTAIKNDIKLFVLASTKTLLEDHTQLALQLEDYVVSAHYPSHLCTLDIICFFRPIKHFSFKLTNILVGDPCFNLNFTGIKQQPRRTTDALSRFIRTIF